MLLRFLLDQGFVLQCLLTIFVPVATWSLPNCRSQPGDALFPTNNQFAAFNHSIDGHLVKVVPSAEFCKTLPGGCSDAEWFSGVFRENIPGAMLQVSFFDTDR